MSIREDMVVFINCGVFVHIKISKKNGDPNGSSKHKYVIYNNFTNRKSLAIFYKNKNKYLIIYKYNRRGIELTLSILVR